MRAPAIILSCLLVACGGPSGAAAPASASPEDLLGPLSAPAIMADVDRLTAADMAGRGSFQPGSAVAAEYIAGVFAEAGLEVIRQPIPGGAENVIGVRRGDDRAIIVSAHYDHLGVLEAGLFPGADDNASGAAVLLALVRHAQQHTYRHTILFIAFGAEEVGLVGSGVYIREPVWPLERTAAVINFDMVGRNFLEAAVDRPAAVGIIGLEDHPTAEAPLRAAAAAAGLHLVIMPARLLEVFGIDDRTDEWWFRRRGVPSIHFSTGMHDDYHQPSDTPDKLVPEQMARVARTAAGLLGFLADQKGR